MAAAELAKLIRRSGTARWWTPSKDVLKVPVMTLDARSAFGRTDVLVTPLVAGNIQPDVYGSAWMSIETLELDEAVEPEAEELRRRS